MQAEYADKLVKLSANQISANLFAKAKDAVVSAFGHNGGLAPVYA